MSILNYLILQSPLFFRFIISSLPTFRYKKLMIFKNKSYERVKQK